MYHVQVVCVCVCVCVCLVGGLGGGGGGGGGMEGMGHVFNRYTAPITTINMATINDDNK